MSMSVYEPATENGARSWVALMAPAAELAAAVAGTDFVRRQMRNNAPAIAACILYGDEIGLRPMNALAKIHIIDGSPAIAAEAMRALIFAHGHELWFEEQTVSKVTIAGRRKNSKQVTTVTWTLDDARRANLAGKPNWRTYPRAMLTARATAELARNIFADVIGGLMAVEELEDDGEHAGGVATTADPPAPSSRKRRRPPVAAASPSQPDPPAKPEPEEQGPPLPGEPGYDTDAEDTATRQTATTRRLHAQFRELGMDRDQRLRWAGQYLGHQVTSFNELSQDEIGRIALVLASGTDPFGPPEPDLTDPAEHADRSPPLTPSQFRTAVDQALIRRDIVADAGGDLFPGASLDQLTDEQRGELFDAARTRAQGWR